MTEDLDWKFPVAVAELPEEGADYELVPDEKIRAVLARHVDVLAVPQLTARLHVQPDGRGGAEVTGPLQAAVRQTCVVTLEPFDNPISEEISIRFAPAETIAPETDGLVDLEAEEPPDALVDGTLDLAAVVAEFLALSIDPYPRKPGAVFSQPAAGESGGKSSPFAALEKLKGRQADEND
ncbi:MAG: DUF177 domain-containing protein [Bradyrhizobiaceae bacterium]|nr:DUF177 domain-containing protein [Bradyrhizobiaceae bacterium]